MNRSLGNRRGEAVFFCYHSISAVGEEFLALPPETFERQLHRLRGLGFRSGGLADLAALVRGEQLPGRTVFLTFDDGFLDNLTVGLPLMLEYGFRPLVFVLPRHLETGAALDWPEVADGHRQYPETMKSLDWSQVEDMISHGAEFGSHTLTHPHLGKLPLQDLAREVGESRELIIDRLGACEAIAYPFGEWNHEVAAATGAAGYSFAFSLPQGPQAEVGSLCIPRINVDRRDDGVRFMVKLSSVGRRFLLSPAAERIRGLRGGQG